MNRTINGQIAQQQKGATIVLEHRYYGTSNPFPDLSVKSLKYHTIQQAIDDLDYFANNVKLAMPGGDKVKPNVNNPWMLVGGSYSGALTGWTMVKCVHFPIMVDGVERVSACSVLITRILLVASRTCSGLVMLRPRL